MCFVCFHLFEVNEVFYRANHRMIIDFIRNESMLLLLPKPLALRARLLVIVNRIQTVRARVVRKSIEIIVLNHLKQFQINRQRWPLRAIK